MPATKKRPPMEKEPGEGLAHERGETPSEETREGSEPGEPRTTVANRKRSARGAKNTKAPMDSEGGCCNEAKGKSKCSACAAGKPCSGKAMKDGCNSKSMTDSCGGKRGDALTAPEYLAACELGIQNRPRSYIRARLDAAERLDLKCGKGSISQGEKCRKGAASPAAKGSAPSIRSGMGTGFKYGAAIGGGFNAASGAVYGGAIGGIPGAVVGAVGGGALGAIGGGIQGAAIGGIINAGRKAHYYATGQGKSRKKKRTDSIWAHGFDVNPAMLAI